MRYLHKTPEEQLIDLSLQFPFPQLSPIPKIFHYMGIPYPNCWIGIRMISEFLQRHLPNNRPYTEDEYKLPGDFDILGGPLLNGLPTQYIIGIEVKRFKYMVPGKLKNPDSFGRKKAIGYTLFGFNKVMLCHFVVAEPVDHPDCNPWILNTGFINEGIQEIKRRRFGVEQKVPYGYCIAGWAQVPHKSPVDAGTLPSPDIIKPAPDNLLAEDKDFQNIRNALLERIKQEVRQLKGDSLFPVIINFQR